MPIVIVPPASNAPAGKLADAELHFTTGLLAGLKLVGFAIWESQWPGKNLTHPHLRVTVPSREYTVGGQQKRFDLLRSNDPAVVDTLRHAILDAYADYVGAQVSPETAARQVAQAAAPVRRQAPAARRAAPLARVAVPPTRRAVPPAAARRADEPPPHTDDDFPF